MQNDPATILAASRFFAGVRQPSLSRLLEMAVVREFQRGQMIFREGDACPGVFVVGEGLVRIFRIAPNGKEHVLHLVPPGGTFAEVAAIGGFRCPAFAEALENTRCALLPADPFARALRDDHQLCLQLLTGMAMWVKHLVSLVEDITLRDAAGRVARYLLGVADASGRVTLPSLKKHLASHLNLTSETLSRTLRRLGEGGLIEEDADGALLVLDRRAMSDVAEGLGPIV